MKQITTPSLLFSLAVLTCMPLLQACSGCHDNGLSNNGNIGADSGLNANDDGNQFASADWGLWLSSTAMPDGSIALAFYDREQGGIAFANGTPGATADIQWTYEHIDGYPAANGLDAGDRGMYTSLAMSPDGTPWAAYYDVGAHNLRYARRVATPSGYLWLNGIADSGEGYPQNAGLFTSIAFNDAGLPVIAHYDQTKHALRIAHFDGSSFSGEVVDVGEDREPADTGEDLIDADVGMYACLRIANGKEYIAYFDKANGNLKLAIGTAGNYETMIVDEDENVGAWPNMEIRGTTVHIAYQDVGKQHLRYAVGEPSTGWSIEKVDQGAYVGADTALYFDGDNPSIVYFEGYDNDMKLARFDGDQWSKAKIATIGAVGFHNEVVSAGGRFYAASYNYTEKNIFFTSLD
jgi:hypothetical protein